MIRPFTKRDKTNLTCPKCGSNPLLFKDIYNSTHGIETIDQIPITCMICKECHMSYKIQWIDGKPYPLLEQSIEDYLRAELKRHTHI